MFSDEELALLLDAVMVHYRGVEEAPPNDGSDLPAIEALQHKIERLLSTHNHRGAAVTMTVGYVDLAPGGIPDGGVAMTIEAADGIYVDVDADGTVLGVETIGDGGNVVNWVNGLVALAMQGRLRVARAHRDGTP